MSYPNEYRSDFERETLSLFPSISRSLYNFAVDGNSSIEVVVVESHNLVYAYWRFIDHGVLEFVSDAVSDLTARLAVKGKMVEIASALINRFFEHKLT